MKSIQYTQETCDYARALLEQYSLCLRSFCSFLCLLTAKDLPTNNHVVYRSTARHYSVLAHLSLLLLFSPSKLARVESKNLEYFLTPSNWNSFFERRKRKVLSVKAVKEERSAICQCLCLCTCFCMVSLHFSNSKRIEKRDEKTVWDLNRFRRRLVHGEGEKTENNKQTKMKLLTTTRRLAKRRRKKNEKRRQITQSTEGQYTKTQRCFSHTARKQINTRTHARSTTLIRVRRWRRSAE